MNKFDTLFKEIIGESVPSWQVFSWKAQRNLLKNWPKAKVTFDIKATAKDRITKEFTPVKFEVREFLPNRKPPMDGTDTPGCFMDLNIGERGYYGGSWLNVNWANGHYIDIGPFKCQVKNIIEKNYNQATDTSTVKFNIPKFYYCGNYVKGKLVASYYLEGTITIKVPSNILIPPSEDLE